MQKKASFLVAVLDNIRTRLDAHEHGLAAAFTRQFWSRVAPEELDDRTAEDAAGMTVACFRHFQRRVSDAIDIDVANPQFERDGWSSKRTIVRIAHPNMPFITDSVLMELSRHGLVTHHLQNMVFHAVRDAEGQLLRIDPQSSDAHAEVLIYAEIDRLEGDRLGSLEQQLDSILKDVRAGVGDFAAMKARLRAITESMRTAPPPLSAEEVQESIAFLEWLGKGSFTFLGYREFDFASGTIRQVADSALGILRNREPSSERRLADQPEDTRAFLLERTLLAFSKSGTRSQVHRPAYPDYIAVKRFNAAGEVIGEQGFLGLYTSTVYTERPDHIPLLRKKVANIRRRSGLDPDGFDGKILAHVLASYPRDELFQSSEEELFANAMAITQIHERRRTRVFLRRDRYGLFYTCLVFMPRELYNTQLRVRIQQLLTARLGAEDAPFDAYFSESILVRLQFVIRVPPGTPEPVDIDELQHSIVALTRDWSQDLREALVQECGEVAGRRLAETYLDTLPAGYRENRSARAAVTDIQDMERLNAERGLTMRLYRGPEDPDDMFFARVFHLGEPLPLSDLVPALEHMGVRAIGEHPYRIPFRINGGTRTISIHDLELCSARPIDIAAVGERFEETFVRVWRGSADDDSFNRLVLVGGLEWREVAVLRAYARYMKQTLFGFGQEFISDTLFKHPETAHLLIQLFVARFEPDGERDDRELYAEILARLDRVELLNEDRILRRLAELIEATDRTNYFQRDAGGAPKDQLALKLAPQRLTNIPAPVPQHEILVLSTRVEGLHLRAGPIARGGLRWSDRLEDYRTEVLGLVKAQTVKNAVIVPTGAKGGFFVRRPPLARDALMTEAVACYRQFISGLLDVTDNIVNGVVVPPDRVRRYDGDDPYLVVAADKGTATFSDHANDVSAQYGFWLGDAFASGGSNGYDHKKMAITARGAWISVQRHFSERGVDADADAITALGIGDMSGDVFGNGLLRSRSVRLVAAFNHLHVFVDPNPDAQRGFTERARLFELPSSGWNDYDAALISDGGGVFVRTQKAIAITPQMRERFAIEVDSCSPDELIHLLLKAPVDLIWNGGIGTYVKASGESHADVGDRANDAIRVDATELRARVIGEGGNLGMTQAARVEFALAGGGVNTDFIDNAGGVDCSDHEVNLKILFNQLVADGDLTVKQRNQLLIEMTATVADLVLTNNFRQAQALSIAERHARDRLAEYQRFMSRMEVEQRLDRALEGVPSDDVLAERQKLTRPELAVLLSYAKTHIKERLIKSSVHADAVISETVFEEFPPVIRERYAVAVRKHRLYREIVATIVANDVVHHLGVSSVVHLSDFVGGEPEDIVRAYYAAARCFGIRETYRSIESLQSVDGETRLDMLLQITQLARRSTRWLLRHRRNALDVGELAKHFAGNIALLAASRLALMGVSGRNRRDDQIQRWARAGVPAPIAESCANAGALVTTLPVIDAAERRGTAPQAVAAIFANLNATLSFDWLVDQLSRVAPSSLWQAMERDLLLDDLMTDQAALAARINAEDIAAGGAGTDIAAVDRWVAQQAAFVRNWRAAIDAPQRATAQDFSLLSMTCRKLGDLTRTLAP